MIETPGRMAWRRLRKNPGAMIGMFTLMVMIVMAIAAPLITPFEPTTQILEYAVKPAGFRGSVIYKKNPSAEDRPSVIAVRSFEVRGDSLHYIDPAGEPYRLHVSRLQGANQDEWSAEPLFLLGTDRFGRDMFTRLVYGMRVSLTVGVISESIALVIGIFLGALAGYFR
ncbi:MAG: hypothetical protein EHM43_12700, partial [Ignavibacteriae bacterium]